MPQTYVCTRRCIQKHELNWIFIRIRPFYFLLFLFSFFFFLFFRFEVTYSVGIQSLETVKIATETLLTNLRNDMFITGTGTMGQDSRIFFYSEITISLTVYVVEVTTKL